MKHDSITLEEFKKSIQFSVIGSVTGRAIEHRATITFRASAFIDPNLAYRRNAAEQTREQLTKVLLAKVYSDRDREISEAISDVERECRYFSVGMSAAFLRLREAARYTSPKS